MIVLTPTTATEEELSLEVRAQLKEISLFEAELSEVLKGLRAKGLTKAGIGSVLENALSPSSSLYDGLVTLSEMVSDEELVTAVSGMGPASVTHLDIVRGAIRVLCEVPCPFPGERDRVKKHAHKEDIVRSVEDQGLCAEDVTKAIDTLRHAGIIYKPRRDEEIYAWL